MKKRYFFVIYLHNNSIKTLLDGMRIIADPMQKNFSHITVKGPYWNIQKKRLNEDSKLIEGKEIKVTGVGNFFKENQNTVFLRCEEKQELYNIWKTKEEKTYNEFHPHITIYDGKDSHFAYELFETINSHAINFSFIVAKLDLYSSTDKTILFNLKEEMDYPLLTKIAGYKITKENIESLTNEERIKVINKLCVILEKVEDKLGDYSKDYNPNLHDHRLLIEI